MNLQLYRISPIAANAKPIATQAYASLNFFFSTPWLMTTARSRADGVHHRDQALRRSIHQEQQLGVDLFLRRHGGQRLDLLDRDHAAFDHARLEGELRIVLGVLRQRLGQRDRIALGVGDRSDARQILQRVFDLVPLAARSASVFFTTRYLAPELRSALRSS